ncbi:MAG: methyl-accepting chemotaxis protein [Sulfuriferula sp.]|nr:methyl-accepting chemotaxis protein [Sulfuriferula sp.]
MNNMKIGMKLWLAFGLSFIALAIVGLFGLRGISQANQNTEEIYQNRLIPVSQMGELNNLMRQNIQIVLTATIARASTETTAKYISQIESNTAKSDQLLESIQNSNMKPEGKALFDDWLSKRNDFMKKGLTPALSMLKDGNFNDAEDVVLGVFIPRYEKAQVVFEKLAALKLENAKQSSEQAVSTFHTVRNTILIVSLLGLALAALAGFVIIKSITQALNEAILIAKNVADGDLTQKIEVTTTNEFGQLLQALDDMNTSLVKIISEVRSGTESIASASGQIAAGNLDLSSRTESQAGSLEETASAMEQLTSTVKQNADNARQANQLAETASEVAGKGGAVVSDVVNTMGLINESARKIADIIGVIDGIAFQTNILALNAAVEAARAGEQGRGFAVVATEVRSLAQRSAAAAKEIKLLIDDSVEKVEQGNKQAAQAGTTMGEVVSSVQRVTDIMSEITAASREQSQGIEEVNQAITQIDETTQQNAALVEEAAAAAKSLQDQAGHLEELVDRFKLETTRRLPQPLRTPMKTITGDRSAQTATRIVKQPLAANKKIASTASSDHEWEEF